MICFVVVAFISTGQLGTLALVFFIARLDIHAT